MKILFDIGAHKGQDSLNKVKNNSISHIDYLHCDAQGSDLKVLVGLRDKIKIIKEGCVEATIKADSLYLLQNTFRDTALYLLDNNFMITNIQHNARYKNEVNIYFQNKNYV